MDDKAFQESMRSYADQIPYAMSVAINGLAKDVQEANFYSIKHNFHVRREPFLKYSNKISQFAKKDALMAVIGIVPVGENKDSVYTKFQDGGVKTSITGGKIAVPSSDLGIGVNAIIPQRLRPRNLPSATTAKITAHDGRQYIFTTLGRGKNRQFRLAYMLLPEVKIAPMLDYYTVAQQAIERNYQQRVEAAMQRAIETAK
jgi:hypothetical protein